MVGRSLTHNIDNLTNYNPSLLSMSSTKKEKAERRYLVEELMQWVEKQAGEDPDYRHLAEVPKLGWVVAASQSCE
eukprot:896528-Pyramimonas_sp.AAC.1